MHRPPDDPQFQAAKPPPKRLTISNEVRFSWMVALGVLLTYATLAIFGARGIMEMEAKKHKFQSVEVQQPISFFDRSYMVKDEIGPDGSPVTQ